MAIAQQLQDLSPEELVSFPRSTQDYIPKAHSKLPFNFAAIAWDIVDSDQFRHLSGESIKLYVYLARHVDLRLKQKTRSNGEYLLGRTFAKKYETIAEDCYGGRKSARSVQRYVTELVEAELIEVEKGWGNVCTFTLMAFHQTQKIQEYETNAVQREFQIQQAALRNNKLRLLRQEKDQVIEVEAPAELVQPLHQIPDTTSVSTPDTTPVSTLNINRNSLKETPSSYQKTSNDQQTLFSFQTNLSNSDQHYQQLKLLTLQLWQDQQQKLGNPLPSNADLYQIMRQDHPLGIDAFASQACQLSPHVNPIQALQLLQECIKIMPKTGGNGRPVGRPGWFLLSISDSFFKRAWANTFDFLPLYWQQHQNTAPHPRSLKSIDHNRNQSSKPRSSHF